MNLAELKSQLRTHSASNVTFLLPDGSSIPAHYHVTEVGHVAKKFADCGGAFLASEVCLLQTYLGSPADDGHRLTAGKLAKILELAKPILPTDDLPVEVEYEAGVISQFPLEQTSVEAGALRLHLGRKHTDCRAKEKCGIDDSCGCTTEATEATEAGEACCAGTGGSKSCC